MVQVAIIGGGFAGLALALLLHKHGIASAVYETRPKEWSSGGNIALAPNALRVLNHIGIYDRLRTLGFNYKEINFTNGSGEVLGRLLNGSQNKYNFKAVRIHRLIVRNELLKELDRQGIPNHFDKKCIGIVEETAHTATVEFQDGERVQADFVIGADGLHSRIRPHTAENTEPKFSGLMGVMGTIMADQLQDIDHGLELPCMLFGQSGSFAIMPASFSGNEVGYFATIESTDRGRDGWHALETDKHELNSMLKQRFLTPDSKWPKMVTALCERTPPETLTSWPFFIVPHLNTFTSPAKRVILIGDAAHAIPPTGGQGRRNGPRRRRDTRIRPLARLRPRLLPTQPAAVRPPRQMATSPHHADQQGRRLHRQKRCAEKLKPAFLRAGRQGMAHLACLQVDGRRVRRAIDVPV